MINPTPGGFVCPDGGGPWVWAYPGDGPVPDGAKRIPCADPDQEPCYLVPASACINVVETKTDPFGTPNGVVQPTLPDPRPPLVFPPPPDSPRPPAAPPTKPFPTINLPIPGDDCTDGTGYDFETFLDNSGPDATDRGYATFQGWHGDGVPGSSPFLDFSDEHVDYKAAPVYGNAVPIQRIRPYGWQPNIETNIGGDYWKFSQDINQGGSFWVGSMDRRYSWRQHPGEDRDTWGEPATGTLTSRDCRLQARYLTFKIGGSVALSQRVELEVQGATPSEYFGLWFGPGKLGDWLAGGALGYTTQFVGLPTATPTFTPGEPGWNLVRASTAASDPIQPGVPENDYMQVHVWDLAPFVGRRIRIRVVDDRRQDCTTVSFGVCLAYRPEHINVDDFRFTAAAPTGTVWNRYNHISCGGVPGTGDGCSPDGFVPAKIPLWGLTDVHAHPMGNIAFNKHFMWGDVSDDLESVYDCDRSLPAIPGPGGRPAIGGPEKSTCTLNASVVAIATGVVLAGCTDLTAIPFVGPGLAATCAVVVLATSTAALTSPVLEATTLHGGRKAASGAIKLGLMLSKSFDPILSHFGDVDGAFMPGLIPTVDSVANGPTGGWWSDQAAWHSRTGLYKSHNAYQKDMIQRAYQGGLRLAVWDVINSRAIGLITEGVDDYDDWRALQDGTDAAKRIVGGPLAAIAEIAYSPADAVAIVRKGKLAVILGSEVDELGRMRPEGRPFPESATGGGRDSMQKQINDLWRLGIRKITPTHAVNNPIGGTALFTTLYELNNNFVSNSASDGDPSLAAWRDHSPLEIFTGPPLPELFRDILLGLFSPTRTLERRVVQPPWNPTAWFDFDTTIPTETVVGDADKVTFRIGADGYKDKRPGSSSLKSGSSWLPPDDVMPGQLLVVRMFNNLSWIIGGVDSLGSSNCSLQDNLFPEYPSNFDAGGPVDSHYVAIDGHRNRLGLYQTAGHVNDGVAFLRAAMKKGMLIDLDHLSQKARVDAYLLANQYAGEAGLPTADCAAGLPCHDYPFVGVHSRLRGVSVNPSTIEEYRNAYGHQDEASRTDRELQRLAANGGAIAAFVNGSMIVPPNTPARAGVSETGGQCTKHTDCANYDGISPVCIAGTCSGQMPNTMARRDYVLPGEVANDCDKSSKTYAVEYLSMMRLMGGKGLTPSTDFNGLMAPLSSRFGTENQTGRACGGATASSPGSAGSSERSNTDLARAMTADPAKLGWSDIMLRDQQWEFSGVWYDDYTGPVVPILPDPGYTTSRYLRVTARTSSQLREDLAPRGDKSGMHDESVFFNNHGPDNANPLYKLGSPTYQRGNRPGAQMAPIKRWRMLTGSARNGWDFNLDGLLHIGLYPDLFQDLRNVGVQWEQMTPLFHSTQDYIDTWKRAVEIGKAHS